MSDEYLSDAFIKSLHAQVVEMKGDVSELRTQTQKNSESIDRVEKNTSDVVDLFKSLEGGFKVLQGLGRMARPVGWIAGAVAAILGLFSAWKGLK